MFGSKFRRVVSGVCVGLMIFASFGDNAVTAFAAEPDALVEEEALTETSDEEAVELSDEEAAPAEELTTEESFDENGEETEVSEEEVSEEIEEDSELPEEEASEEDAELPEEEVSTEEIEIPEEEEVEAVENVNGINMIFDTDKKTVSYDGKTVATYTETTIDGVKYKNLVWTSTDYNEIPQNSFAGDTSIISLSFKAGCTNAGIGVGAFTGCTNLKSIDFSNAGKGGTSFTQIGNSAFKGCTSLTDFTLPTTTSVIGENAFESCVSLTSISFPASISKVGSSAFGGCAKLSKVKVDCLQMNKDVGNMTGIFEGCNISDIELNKSITVFPTMLFGAATFATGYEVVIPSQIQEIGNNAFDKSNISKIRFEEPSALIQIDLKAFNGCSKLTSISLPDGLQNIGESAFNGSGLTSIVIPNSVTGIGQQAFSGCISLTEVTLPSASSTNYSLGAKIFEKCINLNNVQIPNTWTYIGDYMFSGCTKLDSITLSTSLTEIGKYAFEKTAIVTMNIPSGVNFIGDHAFSECSALYTVKFPTKLTEISASLFYKCVNFVGYAKSSTRNEFAFPSNLTEIGQSAFEGCASLKFSSFPDSLEIIGQKAFLGCAQMESITITPNVKKIGQSAFQGCTQATKVTINSLKITEAGTSIFYECLINEVSLNSSMTVIPDNLFSDAGFATNVTIQIPDSVTKIGKKAFGGSQGSGLGKGLIVKAYSFGSNSKLTEIGDNAFQYNTAMEAFTIPKSVKVIGQSAFLACSKLQEITIPVNVTKIGIKAFANCENMSKITYNAANASISSTDPSTCIFSGCNISSITLGTEIVVLPAFLFYGASFAKKTGSIDEAVDITLVVPVGLQRIGSYCLAGVTNLKELQFQPNNPAFISVDPAAFYNCSGLEIINLPDSTTTIGDRAFEGCTKLTGINLPANLNTLGSSAFLNCPNITSVTIPANIDIINNSVFSGATKLATVNFASSDVVTEIGVSAFEGCSSLTEIDLPETVETIGSRAFYGCSAIQKMDIPYAVSSIADDAFTSVPKSALFSVVLDSYAHKWLKDRSYTKFDTSNSIVYELNGGTNDAANPHRFKGGETIPFASPTRSGASFDGWYFDSSFETETRVPEKVKLVDGNTYYLYAKWKLDDFNLTVVNDGGVVTGSIPAKFTCDDTIELPTTVTKEGSEFLGWSLSSSSNPNSLSEDKRVVKIENGYPCNSNGPITSVKAVGDIKLYAIWRAYKITVYYHDTMGKVEEVVKTQSKYTDGKSKFFTEKEFGVSHSGYELIEWNTKAALNGTGFLPGEPILDLLGCASEGAPESSGRKVYSIDLYANWDMLGKAKAPRAYLSNKNGSMVEVGRSVVDVYPGDIITLISDSTDATIFYVTDSSKNPSTQGEKYTDVIIVPEMTGTFTVKAMAKKEIAGAESPVATFNFNVIDKANDWGDVLATDRAKYNDATEVPLGIWFSEVKDAPYTGKAVTLSNLRVYFGTKLLEEKKDYTVKYTNNKKVADAATAKKKPTVTITGKGSFKGKASKTFSIVQTDISKDVVATNADEQNFITIAANGKAQKVVPALVSSVGYKLKKKTDFTVSYPNTESGAYKDPTNPTDSTDYYSIIVTGKGGFTGTREFKLKITKPDISIAKVTIKGKYKFTGEVDDEGKVISINPSSTSITVKMGKKTLKNAVDYAVSYGDNTGAGTGTVIIEGRGDYIGSKIATFTISGISIAKSKITLSKTSVPYTGEEIKIGDESGLNVVKFEKSGKILGMGEDYEISGYSKNIKKGTATITFAGKGIYSGTIKKTFKIVAAEFSTTNTLLDVKYSDGSNALIGNSFTVGYTPGGAKPEITVSYNGIALKNKTDYTVSYEKNLRKSTSAEVIITGKGNFKGTVTGKFTITAAELSDCKITVDDVIYEGKEGAPKPVATGTYGSETFKISSQTLTYGSNVVVSNNGENITRSAGDKINSKDIIPVGTLIIDVLKGSGNYTGTVTKSFRVVTQTISNATVTVKKQGYNYNGVVPNKSDIMVKLDKYTTLNDSDYVIIDCYNNFDAGTGYLVIRGVGEYGGVKTVKFTIDKQSF